VEHFLSLICHNTFTCKQCDQNSHCSNGFKLRFVSRVTWFTMEMCYKDLNFTWKKRLDMFKTILHNKTSQSRVHIWRASCQCKRNKIKCSFTTLSCKYMYPSTLSASTLIILFSENVSLKFVKEIRESLWMFYFQHEIFIFN